MSLVACLAVVPNARGVTEIVEIPVAFTVRNSNTSLLPCPSDGGTYTLEGHIVAPREALVGDAPKGITLYLPGGTAGEYLWHLTPLRAQGYDTTWEMAKLGHVSLTIDPLGYDSSTEPAGANKPNGWDVCIGSYADMHHQVVDQLRRGTYSAVGASAPAFDRVALAAESGFGSAAQAQAYSYRDVDALVLVGWADHTTSLVFPSLVPAFAARCALGGEPSEDDGTGPRGYAYLWPSADAQAQDVYYDIDPAVTAVLADLRNRDACGGVTLLEAFAVDQALVPTITAPVLLVYGEHEKLLPPPAGQLQAARYLGSKDVSLVTISGAGHVPMLERPAPLLRAALHEWLAARDL